MIKKASMLLRLFILCNAISSLLGAGDAKSVASVLDFNATGDGKTDDSQAFLKAWENLCRAHQNDTQTLQIPANKTFLLQPFIFNGPCTAKTVHIQIVGNIISPRTSDAWKNCSASCFLCFYHIDDLIIDGVGTIDGGGSSFWPSNDGSNMVENSCRKSSSLSFHGNSRLQLRGITLRDSPRGHVAINNCTDVTISNIHILAPENSPNTDGIDISESNHITIFDSSIGAGDDCVAINGGSYFINVTNVTCGPGHGISVGSLGKDGANDIVEEVHVGNCTFNGTQNGARIKTWQGGSGYARNIIFDQIELISSQNPIIIDQNYGDSGKTNPNKERAVAVSNVTFSNFHGTSESEQAISLDCNNITGCDDIKLNNVNMTSSVPRKEIHASCNNAQAIITSCTIDVPCPSSSSSNINQPISTPTPAPSNDVVFQPSDDFPIRVSTPSDDAPITISLATPAPAQLGIHWLE